MLRPLILVATAATLVADERPTAPPRAISGDDQDPQIWQERLTITVGAADADIMGADQRAIQAAVDAVSRHGGGTVRLLPGTYRLRNSVFLASGVTLEGAGPDTVLVKEPSASSLLEEDSDWYDQEITLKDPSGFRLGDGVCLRAASARFALKRTLVARSGNRFRLDRPLRDNLWTAEGAGAASAATLFPLLSGENLSHVVVRGLTLDGNRAENEELDGNYAGCIWLQDCRHVRLEDLVARHNHGDGLSWQVCHDVTVLRCHSHGHSGLGLHPGSGSQRSVIRECLLEDNDTGLFFCWGVRGAIAENNTLRANRLGISLGHRDTHNLIRRNFILANREAGILFRPEKDAAAAAHHNQVQENHLAANGVGIDVAAPVRAVRIQGNLIELPPAAGPEAGIRVRNPDAQLALEDNTVRSPGAADTDRP